MDSGLELINLIRASLPAMSKGQKKIAEYVINNYDDVAFLTAEQLGKKAGVSESSVVRFATALGLTGYPEFNKRLAADVKNKIRFMDKINIEDESMSSNQVLDNVLRSDANRILDTLSSIDTAAFDIAVADILAARNVYIVGLRNSASLASFLGYYLKMIRPGVAVVNSNNTTEILEELVHLNKEDVVIGISFPRYSMNTLKALEFANDRNAKIIGITDSKHSPLNMYSSCNLFGASTMASIVDSLVAPMSIINALIVALCMASHEVLTDNLYDLESVLATYQTGYMDNINYVNDNVYEELRKISGDKHE